MGCLTVGREEHQTCRPLPSSWRPTAPDKALRKVDQEELASSIPARGDSALASSPQWLGRRCSPRIDHPAHDPSVLANRAAAGESELLE